MEAKKVTRRNLLRMAAVGVAGLAAACQPKVVEKVVKETVLVPQEVEKVVKETVVVEGEAQIVKETVVVEAQPAPKEPVEIRYLTWLGGFIENAMSLAAAYKDANPHVSVKIEEVGYFDAPPKYQTTMAAGTAADIMYHSESMSRFYDAGQILELTDYVAADGWDYHADFFDGLGADFYHGKQYGWTHMYESTAINYNKTMIEEFYGQDLWEAFPDGAWDWNDLFEVSKACSQDLNGDGRIDQWGLQVAATAMTANAIGPLVWGMGDSWIEPHLLRYDCTSETVLKGWYTIWDWLKKDEIIIPNESTQEISKAMGTGPFYAGMTAMYMRFATDVRYSTSAIGSKFEWDSFPLPKYGERFGISEIAAHPHCVWSGSKAKQAAYDFIKYLGTEPGLMPLMLQKWWCPPIKRPGIYEALRDAYLRTSTPAHAHVWLDALDKGGGTAPIMRYDTCEETRQLFGQEIELLYAMDYEEGKAALPEFMQNLETKLNESVVYTEPLPYPGEQIPTLGTCAQGDCTPVAGPNV